MSTTVRKALRSDEPALRQMTERACNDPQRMRARKTEAEIMEKMCRPGRGYPAQRSRG